MTYYPKFDEFTIKNIKILNVHTDADHCASGPCRNGGTCKKVANGYKCTCVAGWTGKNCQTSKNS